MLLLRTACFVILFTFGFWLLGLSIRKVVEGGHVSQTPGSGYRIASFAVLGAGVSSIIWQFLALEGWLSALAVFIVMLAAMTLGVGTHLQDAKLALTWVRSWLTGWLAQTWAWRLFELATLALLILGALNVTRSIAGDGEAQNFAVAKVVGQSGLLAKNTLPGLFEFRLYMGLLGEMHQAAMIACGSFEAAKMMDWPLTVISAILISGICFRVGLSRRAQIVAVFIFLSGHGLFTLMCSGKVEIFAMALAIGALFWSVETCDDKSRAPVFYACLLAGLAIVAKLSYGIPLLVSVVGCIAWFRLEDIRNERGKYLANILALSAVAGGGFAIGVAPLFLKNYWLYQNAFATFISPVTAPILGMKLFDDETAIHAIRAWPLAIALMPSNDNLSILLPASLPLILLLPKPRSFCSSRLVVVTCVSILAQLVWICLKPNIPAWRYIYPCFVLFFPIAAAAIEHTLTSAGSGLKSVKLALATMICLLAALQIEVFHQYGGGWAETVQYFSQSDRTYCDWAGAACAAVKEINLQAGPHDRVFVASESRFYLRTDLIQSSSTAKESGLDLVSTRFNLGEMTPENRWKTLKGMGFRYIFYEHGSRFSEVFESLKINQLPTGVQVTKLFDNGALGAYRID